MYITNELLYKQIYAAYDNHAAASPQQGYAPAPQPAVYSAAPQNSHIGGYLAAPAGKYPSTVAYQPQPAGATHAYAAAPAGYTHVPQQAYAAAPQIGYTKLGYGHQ